MRIIRYTEEHRAHWEVFVSNSKNGTFHLSRNFIGYHGTKFMDHSLLAFDEEELVGVLPMNESGREVFAHQGLTYGGWVLSNNIRLDEFQRLFITFLQYLEGKGIEQLHYKTIPFMYHQVPAQEDVHMLFLAGAKCTGQHVNPVIIPSNVPKFQERRVRGMKKALNEGIEIRVSEDFDSYYTIVEDLLAAYSSTPAHSRSEILDLQKDFQMKLNCMLPSMEKKCGRVFCVSTPRIVCVFNTSLPLWKGKRKALWICFSQRLFKRRFLKRIT